MLGSIIGFSLALLLGIELLCSIPTANGQQPCSRCANNNNQNQPAPQQNSGNGQNFGPEPQSPPRNSAAPSSGTGGQCQPSSNFDRQNGCFDGSRFDPDSQTCVPPPSNCQQNSNGNGSGNQNGNSNGNANGNENQNSNANQNQNANSNANSNSNRNQNANSADNTNNNVNNNNINIGSRGGK